MCSWPGRCRGWLHGDVLHRQPVSAACGVCCCIVGEWHHLPVRAVHRHWHGIPDWHRTGKQPAVWALCCYPGRACPPVLRLVWLYGCVAVRGHAMLLQVSLTMSLSISFTVLVDKVYGNNFDCADDPHCWREYVRVYALLCGGVFALGVVALAVRPQRKSPQQPAAGDVEDQTRRPADDSGDVQYGSTVGNETGGQAAPAPVRTRVRSTDVEMTLAQSVRIFRKPFFVAIFFANTIGLGAGILVITAALQMWCVGPAIAQDRHASTMTHAVPSQGTIQQRSHEDALESAHHGVLFGVLRRFQRHQPLAVGLPAQTRLPAAITLLGGMPGDHRRRLCRAGDHDNHSTPPPWRMPLEDGICVHDGPGGWWLWHVPYHLADPSRRYLR